MESKKKICLILPRLASIGGVQKIIQQRCHALSNDFEFHIIVTNENTFLEPIYFCDMSEISISFFEKSLKRNPLSWILKLRKKVRLINPELVIVLDNGLKGLLIPWIFLNSHIYYERHGAIHFETNKKWYYPLKVGLFYLLALKFKKIFFLNQSMSNKWLHPNKIVIENGTKFPKELANVSLNNILWIGRESVEKGIEDLYRIWKKIKTNYPEWNLLIYTPKPIETNLWLEEIENGCVINIYNQKNLKEIYYSGSILIQTSHYEGFGLTILEAMSFGLPVISWDCEDGPRHLIANNKSGFLIPEKNFNLYVEKLSNLISDETLRKSMGNAGYERSQYFNIDKIHQRWKNEYQKNNF